MWKPAAISDIFSNVLEVMIMKLDYIFSPFFLYIFSYVIDGVTTLQLNKKYRKEIDSFW